MSDRGDLEGVDWYVGDLFDDEALRSLVDGADVVFHLAGVSLWNATPEQVHRVNVDGTEHVLEACRDSETGRFVFTSTAGTRRPPDDAMVADETDVATPVGAYQSSKAQAEQLIDQYAETDGDAVTVHRRRSSAPVTRRLPPSCCRWGSSRRCPPISPAG